MLEIKGLALQALALNLIFKPALASFFAQKAALEPALRKVGYSDRNKIDALNW